jgi:nickel/cobalt exporter
MRRLVGLGVLLLGLVPLPVLAHPHIFIDAKARIVFDAAGEVVAIHNQWTFDEAYSAWSIQGLDTNSDGQVTRAEMQGLADDNMDGLSEYEYYTFAGEGPDNLSFVRGSNPAIDYVNGQTTLNFDVSLKSPYRIKRALEIAINDPEYYVAISFKDASAIELVNAPKGCAVTLEPGHAMPDDIAAELSALPADVTTLPPALAKALRGVQGAILVKCPTGAVGTGEAPPEAKTALGAVNAVSATPAGATPLVAANDIPFGGPPPEPGLNLPRTGFFGWVQQVQRDFYQGLTAALGRLKTDWTAFWVLGGLSFLYGVFHAAGPGHGKIVISSYVLANEQQMRRGMWLSFLAAMTQSVVAVSFVLVLSALLGLTSMAMSKAADWIGMISYAMVALLGLWLIVRQVMGWGHGHAHTHDDALPEPEFDSQRPRRKSRAHALLHGPQTELAFAAGPDPFGRTPDDPHYGHDHGHDAGPDQHDHASVDSRDHAHVVMPSQTGGSWREQMGVVLAVGLRPCSGALVVLVFALSQGVLAAGIVAVVLMGLGTAITTGTLAAIAVGAKGLARGLAGADNRTTATLVWWAELAGAALVCLFGVVLLLASL